jgi:hypothetical protein
MLVFVFFCAAELLKTLNYNTMSKRETLSNRIGKTYMPPDADDVCWQTGSETFTRDEVAHLLWTQIAMIANDFRTFEGDNLTDGIYDILNNPRIPEF